jgi:hypothetical protein
MAASCCSTYVAIDLFFNPVPTACQSINQNSERIPRSLLRGSSILSKLTVRRHDAHKKRN